MPKNPKDDCKELAETHESTVEDTWVGDQKERPYYYDDAHGYEKYVEEEGDGDEESGEQP